MKTCLIVDDSGPARAVTAKILARLGLSISEAEDGLQALESCETALPDSILLDWNMPAMNGLDFLKTLSARVPKDRMPTIVFCTAETGMRQINDALAAGATGYVMKPFDHQVLESTFRKLAIID